MLSGTLHLIVDEDESTLRSGQIAEFDTRRPHWFGPADGRTVELLHLTTPHADQPVVRTVPPATTDCPTDPPDSSDDTTA